MPVQCPSWAGGAEHPQRPALRSPRAQGLQTRALASAGSSARAWQSGPPGRTEPQRPGLAERPPGPTEPQRPGHTRPAQTRLSQQL